MRQVSARASATPWPRSRQRKNSPLNRLPRIATNITTTKTLSTADSSPTPDVQYARRLSSRASAALGALLVVVLVPAFVALGLWQLHKAEAGTALQAALEDCARAAPGEMPVTPGEAAQLRHRRYVLRGQFDAAGQVLLDNRVHDERAGYQVLTPLRLDGADMHVLVDRGWVPAGAGRAPPPVTPPAGRVVITGVAVDAPARVFTLGDPVAILPNAAVWQQLDFPRLRATFGRPLQPVVVRLDPAAEHGYLREWPRADERSLRHLGYAWQWFGFALAVPAIWLVMVFRK